MRRFLCLLVAAYYNLLCSYRILRVRRRQKDDVIHTTSNNVEIRVYPGKKTQSPFDFVVSFEEPGIRERTPRHVHLIVEMYVKHAHNPPLTLKLRDHILNMLEYFQPVDSLPPVLQFFQSHLARQEVNTGLQPSSSLAPVLRLW